MTNDELKKKIVDILIKADENIRNEIIKATKDNRIFLTEDNQYYYIVADALIAAGCGDVKEAEHRAKVAERAVRVLARKFVISVFPNGDWKELIEQLVSEVKKQAEKELAEEGKDD